MIFLIVFLCALLVAAGLGLMSALSDIRGMIIPNMYPAGVLLAFIFAYMACELGDNSIPFQKLSSHMAAGVLVFIVTFCMTMAKLLGGGDSKLMTAYAFWMGARYVLAYLFVMACVGLVLSIVAIVLRRAKPFKTVKEGSWIARLQGGQAVVPYGIPIVAGALFMFIDKRFISLDALTAFLNQAG
ncbi:MAG: prepilin peptidase [Micavibrio sp.]